MAGRLFVVIIVCCLISELHAQTNYCTKTYCPAAVQNVGCNPPETSGGPGCSGKSPIVVVLNATLQSLILTEHNTRRSQLALGRVAPFLPAIRMPTITWDTELANQAGNNARNCTFANDRCRNTAVYAWVGQNLALTKFFGITKTIEQLLKEAIESWWSGYSVTTQAQLNSYPRSITGPGIGLFTQMVSDQTAKMGCALQHWMQSPFKVYYLVCNYAVTNVVGTRVYKNGTVGSGCATGRNPIAALNGLCSIAEKINPLPN
ncbi:antigen 5 like allergen Cul n 1-like [Anopheles maculipalpis]|uniref:antigen 5 like allergen Cul n 1-like n=1 Tax=Anopheles maculipalpis TaxID=1496333 RepID=UPI00215965BB|nr:antigen 5 like allergen Cul n 1-like [Anopheles maculipalpis]